jgi:glycosyltransferase involved in cell wall biosynthesis
VTRILFVHSRRSEFIEIDRALLAERWQVRDWYQPGRWTNVPRLLREVRRADFVFGWFISWHAFAPILLARLLRRPVVWVVGGFDTASVPEIGYGSQRGGPRKWVTNLFMRSATRLITNSQWSLRELETHVGIGPERVTVVYHGIPDRFAGVDVESRPRQPMALTVGVVFRGNLRRKGLLPFVRAASRLPEVRFVVAGAWTDDAIELLRREASPNVEFTGWLTSEELARHYLDAAVYVQASRHEGFGMTVAEAMLAGAIPVVTPVAALPEVVGDVGVVAADDDPDSLAAAIRAALARPPSERAAARRRALELFNLDVRRAGLWAVVRPLLPANDD